MVLDISQDLPFWVTVEVLYFSCCDVSCGQGVEQLPKGDCVLGHLLLALILCQNGSPLVHYDSTWIKMLSSCILSCLFALDLFYNLPHLTEPVESSQNQSHNHFRSAKQDKKHLVQSAYEH